MNSYATYDDEVPCEACSRIPLGCSALVKEVASLWGVEQSRTREDAELVRDIESANSTSCLRVTAFLSAHAACRACQSGRDGSTSSPAPKSCEHYSQYCEAKERLDAHIRLLKEARGRG